MLLTYLIEQRLVIETTKTNETNLKAHQSVLY